MSPTRLLLVLLVAAGGFACGSGEEGGTQCKGTVGPDGGTVTCGYLALLIPLGAFDQEVDIVISLPAQVPPGNLGLAYHVLDPGVKPAAAMTVAYEVKGEAFAGLNAEQYGRLRLAALEKAGWNVLDSQYNVSLQRVVGTIESFGTYGLYLPPVNLPDCEGRQCSPDGLCGTCGEHGVCVDGQCQCTGRTCSKSCCGPGQACFQGKCCQPACADRTCGDDGCGATCGLCAEDQICEQGACLPVNPPDCENKECGPDGAGGSCGECTKHDTCVDGKCTCVPDCDKKQCGQDGCGSSCGECKIQSLCVSGICICAPNCTGKACGTDDGCGGHCSGLCDDHNVCTEDVCQPPIGCVHVPISTAKACDDDDLCTKFDHCAGKECIGVPVDCSKDEIGECKAYCNHANGKCVVEEPAGPELCNGLDDDCDGKTDEGLNGKQYEVETACADIIDVGVCWSDFLKTRCGEVPETGDKGFLCDLTGLYAQGLYVATEEGDPLLCDGLDNDCDGKTDEGISASAPDDLELLTSCKYLGQCAGGTIAVCNPEGTTPGQWECNYDAVAAIGPGFVNPQLGVEIECDGLDNDCDGQTDEELSFDLGDWAGANNPKIKSGCPWKGVCAGTATWGCELVEGEPTWICDLSDVPYFEATEVSCDKLDNDCNGLTDEELDDAGTAGAECKNKGVCQGSWPTAQCLDGQYLCFYDEVDDYEPAEATCDGLDNDCDGLTDEKLVWQTSAGCKSKGVCDSPMLQAICAGEWGWDCLYDLIDEYESIETSCDGLDNDCDGTTDLAVCGVCEPCVEDLNCQTYACKPALGGGNYCSMNEKTCVRQAVDSGACATVFTGTKACLTESQPALCTESGIWYTNLSSCTGDEPVCHNGVCKACIPNSKQCNGKYIQTCASGGSGWINTSVCAANYICLGAGKCLKNDEMEVAGNVSSGFQDISPAVVVRHSGGPVVAWTTDKQSGGLLADVVFRRYSPELVAEAPPTLLNAYVASNQSNPVLASFPKKDGGFVAAWVSDNQDADGAGVFGAIFNKNGIRQVEEDIQFNTFTEGTQESPSVAAFYNGNFLVTWESTALTGAGLDEDGRGIYMRLFAADGTPYWTVETVVNSTTESDQRWPTVANLETEGYVISWTSTGQDAGNQAVLFGSLDNQAGFQVGELLANIYEESSQKRSAAAGFVGDRAGWHLLVWESFGQDAPVGANGVFMNIFNQDGDPLVGNDIAVNSGIVAGSQKDPSVAVMSDNSIVVVWETPNMDSSGDAVAARLFDQWGDPIDGEDEFQVNQNEYGDQENPAVAACGAGGYVVVWADVTNIPYMVDVKMRVLQGK